MSNYFMPSVSADLRSRRLRPDE